jgi:hypothetical protein
MGGEESPVSASHPRAPRLRLPDRAAVASGVG